MKLLNDRYNYGLKLVLLSVDEGITAPCLLKFLCVTSCYRDDSLETVKRNEQQYGIPLKVVSYEELYGWTMDRIVQQPLTDETSSSQHWPAQCCCTCTRTYDKEESMTLVQKFEIVQLIDSVRKASCGMQGERGLDE
ncbi:Cytoplasmic tRNA 2-thiolation protein 1 [Chionoecetes opilio]|uniref:Cytoplasmic tRNA 2-thiolation protein 1 n=1 Tax=Chionoecetes opilio TaxID=41210 RepID=A0A8J4YJ73_CHIOP|nr:Cytoplasmic tRNA 2-thiolation protein 1 [Chionoecetes opilio]